MDGFKNEITLEAVLEDKLSSPVSKTDFRLYLTYEEHSVENLDFFEWYQDYKKRFDDLPCATKSLSPPPQKQYRALGNPSSTTIDMELLQHSKTPPSPIPYIPTFAEPDSNVIELEHLRDSTKFLQRPLPASIPAPTTTTSLQPFRLEIDHILATHIIQGSPNELNLTAAARDYILKHARLTTDPRALLPAVEEALETMRQGSFVNFWKLTAGRNIGTLGRSLWVLAMIWFWIFLPLGFAVVLVPMLLGKSRWWRLLAFPLLWVGVINARCYCTKLCIYCIGRCVRTLLPHEIRAFQVQGLQPSLIVPVTEKSVLRAQWHVWRRWLPLTLITAIAGNLALCAIPEFIRE